MKLDLGRKWALRGNMSQWWDALAASVLTGMDGLGAYLGGEGLTLVQVHKSLGGIQVRGWATYPANPGQMEELGPALQETVAAWNLESCPVSLAVSPHLGFLRPAALPRAALENLAQVVAYELDRFLPLPAENLLYGFQVLEEAESEIRLMLMAVLRDQVEVGLRLLTAAALKPIAVELAPVAAAQVFGLSGRPLPASWLLLHLEGGSYELTHIQGAKVRAFAQGRNLRGKELSQAILAQIDAMAAPGPEPQLLGLYGRGGADFNVGILKKHELEVIYPSHINLKGLQPEMSLDEILPAVGAGLSCVGKAPLRVNLLPPAERAAIRWGRFSLTTMLILILLGLGCLWGASALIHTRVALYRTNRQITKLNREAKQVESLLQESRALAQQMESLRKIGQSPDKLIILKDLTKLIPDNTWLFNLRLSKQYVNLSGMSSSASELIPLLDKSGLFKRTEFASPIVTDANKNEHFKVKAEFKGLEPRP
jgi:Tfp pilus assembly protein PilN